MHVALRQVSKDQAVDRYQEIFFRPWRVIGKCIEREYKGLGISASVENLQKYDQVWFSALYCCASGAMRGTVLASLWIIMRHSV